MRELAGNRPEYILVLKSQLCWNVRKLVLAQTFEKCSSSCSKPRNHIYYYSVLVIWVGGRGLLLGKESLALGNGVSYTLVRSGGAELGEESLYLASGAE